jgi:16S rRNA (adenine1518-N6/adenine1519-N6)-dimethyltransferase
VSLYKVKDRDRFQRFVKTAFAQRRKTLLNNLKSLGVSLPDIKEALQRVSLRDDVRAEQVSIGQFVLLFEILTS